MDIINTIWMHEQQRDIHIAQIQKYKTDIISIQYNKQGKKQSNIK